jgi:hypothetical protein
VILNRVVSLGQYYTLVAGLGLVLVAMLNPGGIAAQTRANIAALRALSARRRKAALIAQEVSSGV